MTERPQSWPSIGSDHWVDDVDVAEDDDQGRRSTKVARVGTILVLLTILGCLALVAFVALGSSPRPVSKEQYCTTLNKWYAYLAHASQQKNPTSDELNAFSRASVTSMQQLGDNPPDSVPANIRSAVHDLLNFFQAGENSDGGISEQRFVRDGDLIIAWRTANCRSS